MSTLPPPVSRPRPSFYVYGVIDKSTDPPTLVTVKFTRNEARKHIDFSPDADNLRARRGRLTLYES